MHAQLRHVRDSLLALDGMGHQREGIRADGCIAAESQGGMAAAKSSDMHDRTRKGFVDGYQLGLAIYVR